MTSANAALPSSAPTRRGGFFGEPKALGFLAFTEAWERFSYYGMTALLALYMTKALLLPGRVEHIAGFAAFRAGLEHLFGPMSTIALASQILGLYTAFIYFTPVLGGIVADRLTGRRAAVVIGAVLMSAGHFAMAFDASFLIALLLLIVGCGLLKGNISTQVGQLYPEDDGEARTRGFAIFSIGINVGAVAGPLLCGLLAQLYGWHAGFGLAGVLMLAGLATYLAGLRHIPKDSPRAEEAEAKAQGRIGAAEWRVIAALGVVTFITVFQSIAYYQNTNINLVWIDAKVDLDLFGFHVPVAWFNSIDPFASIVCVPPLFALWRWQAKRGREPDDIGKVAWGAWIAAASNLLLVAACLLFKRPSLLWPFAYDFGLGVAFLYYWPPLLALVSRAAPTQVKATLMGAVFLSLFLADFLIGRLGALYEPLGPTKFWLLHAGIAAVGGVLALALARPLKRALDIA